MVQWKRVVQHGAQLVKSRRLLLHPSSSSMRSPSSLVNQLDHRTRSRILSDLAGPSGANANRAFSDYASAKSSQIGSADLLKFQEELQSNLSNFQSEIIKSQESRFTTMEVDLARMQADINKIRDDVSGVRWFVATIGYLLWAGVTVSRSLENRKIDQTGVDL
ncbi:unnamed protein product [Linum tenue]|uniref:Uncharacterized protein n=2 Tax=Linum TaxID=4005 RepID=A0AAV0GRK8_9ROSI|nr:unnamed protein product [Linum tenue]